MGDLDPTTLVVLAKEVVELVRGLTPLLPKGENSNALKSTIADLTDRALDLREACANLRDENLQMRQEVSRLSTLGEVRSRVFYEGSWIRVRDPKPHEPPGPCCAACWEEFGRVVSSAPGSYLCWGGHPRKPGYATGQ